MVCEKLHQFCHQPLAKCYFFIHFITFYKYFFSNTYIGFLNLMIQTWVISLWMASRHDGYMESPGSFIHATNWWPVAVTQQQGKGYWWWTARWVGSGFPLTHPAGGFPRHIWLTRVGTWILHQMDVCFFLSMPGNCWHLLRGSLLFAAQCSFLAHGRLPVQYMTVVARWI